MMLKKGYVQVYTGDGKGKTTAALGLAFRASGHGIKSRMIQFMKGQTHYGELVAVEKIHEMEIFQFGTPDFVMKGKERPIDFEEAEKALNKAGETMKDPEISILILDEVNTALYFNLITTEEVLALIDQKPEYMELILTGRNVPDEIIERADLVTYLKSEKHYYDTLKLEGRLGIEY